MARVITPFGLGEAEAGPDANGNVSVFLDEEWEGRHQRALNRRTHVFPFSNWGVVRVVDLGGGQSISNLEFHRSYPAACDVVRRPCPTNEKRFAFDFERMAFQPNRLPNGRASQCITLQTRIDVWEKQNDGITAPNIATAKNWLQDVMEKNGIPKNGIGAVLVLDLEHQRLQSFVLVVAPPIGVIFNKGIRA
jgi:hypothetical protein